VALIVVLFYKSSINNVSYTAEIRPGNKSGYEEAGGVQAEIDSDHSYRQAKRLGQNVSLAQVFLALTYGFAMAR
jgi:hypothetical protein